MQTFRILLQICPVPDWRGLGTGCGPIGIVLGLTDPALLFGDAALFLQRGFALLRHERHLLFSQPTFIRHIVLALPANDRPPGALAVQAVNALWVEAERQQIFLKPPFTRTREVQVALCKNARIDFWLFRNRLVRFQTQPVARELCENAAWVAFEIGLVVFCRTGFLCGAPISQLDFRLQAFRFGFRERHQPE